jgi:hypothetical protein
VLAIVAGLAAAYALDDGAKPEQTVAIQEFRAERPHHWIGEDVVTSRPMCMIRPPGPPKVVVFPNGATAVSQDFGTSGPCPHFNVR